MNRFLLLLLLVGSVRAPGACPADTVGTTSYQIKGEPVECARLASYCGYQHDLQCGIASSCPVTCGACDRCDSSGTFYGTPCAAQNTSLCPTGPGETMPPYILNGLADHCPETCRCGFCNRPSPLSPLARRS